MHKANAGGTDLTPEDYYRVNVFIPILDHVVNDLKFRFGRQQQLTAGLSKLVPSRMADVQFADIQDTVDKYSILLDDPELIEAEFLQWKSRYV